MSTRTEEGLEERPTIGAPEEIEVWKADWTLTSMSEYKENRVSWKVLEEDVLVE